MNTFILAHKGLVVCWLAGTAGVAFLLDLAGASPVATIAFSVVTATFVSWGAQLVAGWVQRKLKKDEYKRADSSSAAGSVDRVSEILANYRTHVDQMMNDHMLRLEKFHADQLHAKDVEIKSKEGVIEMQRELLKQLEAAKPINRHHH